MGGGSAAALLAAPAPTSELLGPWGAHHTPTSSSVLNLHPLCFPSSFSSNTGRLLQHMDETPGFDASGLTCLVLDEADRILDLGFAATLDAILDNLPTEVGGVAGVGTGVVGRVGRWDVGAR